MIEQRYWFLAPANEDESGRLPEAEIVLSGPWWTESPKWVHEEGGERVAAPMIFTTQEAAEAELRRHEDSEADNLLSLVDAHGEETVNRAFGNTAPLRVFGIARDSLADKLADSDFLCVIVNGQMRLRQDFAEELSSDA